MFRYHKLLLLVISMAFLSGELYSQYYSPSNCECRENRKLISYIKSGRIAKLTYFGKWIIGDYVCGWASSSLPPSTKPPKKPPEPKPELDAPEYWEPYLKEYERWSCMHTAYAAMDGNKGTAWCEGKKDDGIGEILMVKVDTSRPVFIWHGLGENDSLFKSNNRPRKIRVYVIQAGKAQAEVTEIVYGTSYSDLLVVASHEVELVDKNGYQPLPLPAHTLSHYKGKRSQDNPMVADVKDTTLVAIKILSVYRGTRYRDTCISEVTNRK